MGMSEHQAFEVQVHQNGRWQVHARYPKDDRASAISEAKELTSQNERLAVRVIMEDYHPETGHHDEVLIYRNRAETTKAHGPKKGRTNWADMAVSSDGRVGFLKEEENTDFNHSIDFEEEYRKKRKVSTTKFMTIVMVIIGIGLLSGALAAGALYLMIIGFGANLAPSTLKSFIMGIFLLVGFIAAISSLNHYRVYYDLNPFAKKQKRRATVRKSKVSKQMERAAEAIDRAPSPKEIKQLEEEKTNIFEREEDPVPPPGVDKTEADVPSFSSQAEQQKMFLVNFLGMVMGALKGPEAPVESLNRFALNLFMAGAVLRVTQDHALNDEEEYTILCHLLEMLGAKSDQAERFAMEYEKYLVDKRHSDLLMKAGEILHAYRDGDPLVNKAIREAIEDWVNFKKHQNDKNPNQLCVFFTDMVGSTDLTTRHGDYAAQEVLKAHDLIVRTALTNFEGLEIKHLGDGIMASFKETDNALEAAREILKRVEGNNNAGPEFPLHIRIGINVGEPLRKNNDLFGNVVQLSSRLCSVAETDNVAVSKFLVEDCGEETPYTFDYQGQKILKGFEQPMDIYQLDWRAPPRVFEETGSSPETDAVEMPHPQETSAGSNSAHSEAETQQRETVLPKTQKKQINTAPPPSGPIGPKKGPQKNMHEFSQGLPLKEDSPEEPSNPRTQEKAGSQNPL